MAANALNGFVRRLRRAAFLPEGGGLSDAAVLERWLAGKDEAAFEAIVRRHGPMVLGVCRRILRNEADAEDAFQATFLVLARRAASIRPRGKVGSWLHGVARNTALKARTMNRKRLTKERDAATRARAEPQEAEEVWPQIQVLLDEELSRLPDKYKDAIVSCDLEGKTIKETALHLGCPQGTVATRLMRGRALLAARLSQRGIVLSGATLAAVLTAGSAAAELPAPLAASTVQAASLFAAGQAAAGVVPVRAVALTEGVLKDMLLTKLKSATAVLLLLAAVVVAGAGLIGLPALAADPPGPRPAPAQADPLPTAEQLIGKLGERRQNLKSLRVEYALTTKAEIDPKRLMSWDVWTIKDYGYSHTVALSGEKYYMHQVVPAGHEYYQPLGEVEVDPASPKEVQDRVKANRDAALNPKPGVVAAPPPAVDRERVCDGEQGWARSENGEPFQPFPVGPDAQTRVIESVYLDGTGLRPGAWTRQMAFPRVKYELDLERAKAYPLPDGLKLYAQLSVAKSEEVDGATCVVLKAERTAPTLVREKAVEAQTLWLDPKLGYAPRKGEFREDGLLSERWEMSGFEEVAPGCWLPKEVRRTYGTPAWAPKELRDKPAVTFTLQVKDWKANGDVKDRLFRPNGD